MNALWQGVLAGSVTPALASFFPRTAYVQTQDRDRRSVG